MTTFFITSTVMIIAVLALRFLFKNQVSFLVLYPLWGIVLLRLLIPFTPIESSISVMNLINKIIIISENTETNFLNNSQQGKKQEETIIFGPEKKEIVSKDLQIFSQLDKKVGEKSQIVENRERETTIEKRTKGLISINKWAGIIWFCGSLILFFYIFTCNLSFYRKLYQNRKQVFKTKRKKREIPVYITDQVASPCLVGVFHPSIYMPKEVYDDKAYRMQVLAHERMHVYHMDHIWTMFRTLCQILYWFDPFVWLAAFYARQDAELACDEAVLRNCTEEERYNYGKMLIEISNGNKQRNFYIITSIKTGKRNLKERIVMITKKRKRNFSQMIGMVLIMALLAGCGLTNGVQNGQNEIEKEIEKKQNGSQEIDSRENKEGKIISVDSKENNTRDNGINDEISSNEINKEEIIEHFYEFMKQEIKERSEWVNLEDLYFSIQYLGEKPEIKERSEWIHSDSEQWNGKIEDLYFSIQYLGEKQIPCLLVAVPSGVIMKDKARVAMVYYYNQEEETVELLTVLRTIGSGYSLQIKEGQFIVATDQHASRIYDLETNGDDLKLKAEQVYGYGTYNEEEKRTIYTYSEFTWQVPLVVEEGKTPYSEDLDAYAENIDTKEDFDEAKAEEFWEKCEYVSEADIIFYHNTEKGWKKCKKIINK